MGGTNYWASDTNLGISCRWWNAALNGYTGGWEADYAATNLIGSYYGNFSKYGQSVWINNITIPPRAIPTSVIVQYWAGQTYMYNDVCRAQVSWLIADKDDYGILGSGANLDNLKANTVTWSPVPAFSGFGWETLSLFTASDLQNILNDPAWASGKALVFIIDDFMGMSDSHAYRSIGYMSLTVQWDDPPPPTLTISTLPAIEITRSSALLNGEVSGSTPDEVYFEWGTDTGYGDTTSSQSAEPDITFSRRLSGLDALTEYHFRAVAVLSGTYYYGEDATFTTTNIFVLDPTIVENTYEVNTVLGQTISTLRGTVHDKLANMDIQEGMDIVSYDISNGEKIFAGITSIVTDYTTGIERYFDLLCQDYSVLLDRTLVYATYPAGFTYVYDSTTFYGDQAIIMDLFQNRCLFPSGAANGQLGPSEITVVDYVAEGTHGLTAMNFLNMTLRECLDLLAGYVNFAYYVDYDKKLHYFYKPNVPAVYGLSSSPNGTTTLGYHGLKRERDATRIVNTFLVLGSQLHGADNFWIHAGNGVGWIFVVNPKLTNGTSVIPIGAPSTTTTGLIQVFINTGSDMAPSWVEDTNGGIYGVDEVLTPSLIPVSHDWLFDPSTNLIYFQTPPPSFATNSFRIGYCLLLNGGLPDTIPGSITKYGRAFTTRLVAQDANTAATILNNLAHLEEQFSYALEILTLSLDSVDFPGNTRFERGQLTHLDNTVLGIDKDYWIHAITVKVAGGTIVSYDLELRSYSLE